MMKRLTNLLVFSLVLIASAGKTQPGINTFPLLGTTPDAADLFIMVDDTDTSTKNVTFGDMSAHAPAAHNHTATDVDAEASADGYVLTSDGAGNAAWEAVSGGGGGGTKTLIQSITSPGGGAFSFTSIPGTYKRLWIEGSIHSSAAVAADALSLQVNGDTTAANHLIQGHTAYNGSTHSVYSVSGDLAGYVPGTSVTNGVGRVEISVSDYTSSRLKVIKVETHSIEGATVARHWDGMLFHKTDTAAITSLRIGATGNLSGTLTLYGES